MRKGWFSSAVCRSVLTCLLAGLVSIPSGSLQADSDVNIIINGQPLKSDVPPIIVNSRTLVPMSAIFTALNARVSWDSSTHRILAFREGIEIELQIDSCTAAVNNHLVNLDAAPVIYRERTMVPLSFIAQSLEETVRWDPLQNTVYIGNGSSLNKSNSSTLSDDQAIDRVIQIVNPGDQISYLVDHEEIRNGSNYYIIKAYVTVDDGGGYIHTSAIGWYYVDKNDGSVYEWDMTDDSLRYLG